MSLLRRPSSPSEDGFDAPAQSSPESVGVRSGDLIAEKYRVEGVLGVGGTAVVVAARHEQLGHRVALKLLSPAMAARPEMAGRFAREGRAAVRLSGEHVARVFDVGQLPSGTPYLVMEHLEGEDLESWLNKRGPLPVEQGVDFVLQACVAVAEAHALGIVHRDIKPGNLFCVRRDDGSFLIKVLDFGIAKARGASGSNSGLSTTRAGTFMGSPLYMSPEQMVGSAEVDERADVWALGVTLFELVCGTPPFEGHSVEQIAQKVIAEAAPSLPPRTPELAAGLEVVIHRCLEKRPQDRYARIHELAAALRPFGPPTMSSSVEALAFATLAHVPTAPLVRAETKGRPFVLSTRAMKAGLGIFAFSILLAFGLGVRMLAVGRGSHREIPGGYSTWLPSPSVSSSPPGTAPAVGTAEDPSPPQVRWASPLDGSPASSSAPRVQAAEASGRKQPLKTRPPQPANGCDPPYSFDNLGRKHFKVECFRQP